VSVAPTATTGGTPGIALPPSSSTDPFPWTILLLGAAPVVAFLLYRVLSGQPVVPRRKRGATW
jgi:hypothetical protein